MMLPAARMPILLSINSFCLVIMLHNYLWCFYGLINAHKVPGDDQNIKQGNFFRDISASVQGFDKQNNGAFEKAQQP